MTGQEYRQIRRKIGLTQKQLAEILGLSQAAISERERTFRGSSIRREMELALEMIAKEKSIQQ